MTDTQTALEALERLWKARDLTHPDAMVYHYDMIREALQSSTEHKHLCGHAEFGSYSGQVILMPPEFLKDRWPTGIGIDVCLALEIQSLWQKGIKTLEHCCGHGRKEGYIAVADECVNDMLSLGYVKADHESGLIFLPKTVLQSRAEQEPVAYRWKPRGGSIWVTWNSEPVRGKNLIEDAEVDIEPLYTSPPDQSARIADNDESVNSQIAQELINWLVDREGFDRGEELHIADVKPLLDDVISHYEVEIASKSARIAELEAEIAAIKDAIQVRKSIYEKKRGEDDVCSERWNLMNHAAEAFDVLQDEIAALHNKLKEK